MIPKPWKDTMIVSSYSRRNILLTISKLVETLIVRKTDKDIDAVGWIPDHQLGFRGAHSTVQEYRRVVNIIDNSMENEPPFLDIGQEFDKSSHPDLLYKIKKNFR